MVYTLQARPDGLPPRFLIEAVPGAAEALAHYERTRAGLAPLRETLQTAINANRGKTQTRGTGPADAFLAPATGVSTAEFEALQSAQVEADLAVRAHTRRVASTRAAFDRLILEGRSSPETRTAAARFASRRHADAIAALATLTDALREREEAAAFLRTTRTQTPNETQSRVLALAQDQIDAFEISSFEIADEVAA